VHEITEDRERARVGVLEREGDGIANAEAHAEMRRPDNTHTLQFKVYCDANDVKCESRCGLTAQKRRMETWFALIVVAVGLIPVAIAGLFLYMSATATRLHPKPQNVPSVTQSVLPLWADAAAQGRRIVRAGLIEQNLPGLSVAVAAGSEIVWAEGFGWADLEKRVPVAPHMRFRIGTASTALSSAAAGLLLEKDRLKLDEEIQTYVPEFPETMGRDIAPVDGSCGRP
jgi:hypothetical protein